MDSILSEVCILVTAAFALTLVPGFRRPERSLLSRRDRGTALLVFTILALIEEATVPHAGSIHERIVAVCAAGLVAGPWVGLAVSVFVTWLACANHGLPLGPITTSMLCAGLVGGLHSSPRPGRVRLLARPAGGWLELSVSDNGQGVSSTEVERVFFAEGPRVHALVLLRRRLQGLFGRSYQLEVRSEVGEGATVTLRIPLRFEVANASLEEVGAETGQLAPN